MNQAPTEEKQNAYIRKIKTVQFIYIIEKVGLMNQAPTRNKPLQKNQIQTGIIKPLQEINLMAADDIFNSHELDLIGALHLF